MPKWLIILVVTTLLAAGALLSRHFLMPWDNPNPDRALLDALHTGNLAKFRHLLARGANPNAHLPPEYGVMCDATEPGKEAFLQAAIAHGGNVNLYTDVSSIFATPLNCAISNENHRAFHTLLDHGADLNLPGCPTCGSGSERRPLDVAANLDNWDMALEILKRFEKAGGLPRDQVDGVIHDIENFYLGENGTAYPQRERVIAYLRARGYTVGPAATYHRPPSAPTRSLP